MRARAYVAVIRAEKGSLLLGGTDKHESSPFLILQNAMDWTDTVVGINRDCGRKVSAVYVRKVYVHVHKAADSTQSVV